MPVPTCVFCQKSQFLLENELAGAFYDTHPMSQGHLLIIPKQHASNFFAVPAATQTAMLELLNQAKIQLDQTYHPRGYQVFSHIGPAAGQTVMHAHLHLVPVY